MKVDYSAYEGREVQGIPDKVLIRGEVVVDDQKHVGSVKHGKFITREPGSARSLDG